jgi:signal peptidase I
VPSGTYFVMSDNRNRAQDSRFYGPVPRKNMVGRKRLILGGSSADC